MKKIGILLSVFFVPLLLWAAAGDYVGTVSSVNFALPKDINGAPLQTASLGLPLYSEAVTLSSSTATLVLTLPTSGNDARRQWRKLMVRNPSSSRVVYLCFVASATCATPNIKVPTSTTLVFDDLYFGPMNTITLIYGKLDTDGSVVPEITIW